MARPPSSWIWLGFPLLAFAACDRAPVDPGGGEPATLRPAAANRQSAPARRRNRVPPATILFDALPMAPEERREGAPISLTAGDGSGLRLRSLRAKAVVEGPLAFTEIALVFENPEPRTREGRFSIRLPSGAAISRFAMLLPTGWQEAELVERHHAQVAYEDFLHRRQDPALLEHEAGNEFSARVFPIPPRGTKEIKIAYSQELVASNEAYRLPLAGLPEMDELAVTALVGDKIADYGKTHHRPERDLVIQLPDHGAALRSEELLVARVRVGDDEAAAPSPTTTAGWIVLFDTSASRAPGFATRVDELGALVEALARHGERPLTVAAFDQTCELVYHGPSSGFGEAELGAIRRRQPLGASDLGAALRWAQGRRSGRLVALTDGVVTAGATGQELAQAVASLHQSGIERFDVVVSGGLRDGEAMARLVRGPLPSPGVVIDGERGADAVLRRLERPVLEGVTITVAGARQVWPAKLDGVQPGDEALVYAELDGQFRGEAVEISLGGPRPGSRSFRLKPVERPLLERALARARINQLSQDLAGLDSKAQTEAAAALKKSILGLSTRFRVLSDLTALIVLETAQDYARFGIDRQALADILVVGESGVELVGRSLPGLPERYAGAALEEDEPGPGRRGEEGKMAKRAPALRRGSALRSLIGPPQSDGPRATASARALDLLHSAAGAAPEGELGGLVGDSIGEAFGAGGLGIAGQSGGQESAGLQGGGGGVVSGGGGGAMGPGHLGTLGAGGGEGWGSGSGRGAAAPRRMRRASGHRSIGQAALDPEASPSRPPGPGASKSNQVPALTGKLAQVMALLAEGKGAAALELATTWRNAEPGEVLALIALGEAEEARGGKLAAARAYGSIIDLYPSRADLRRFAGNRLERLGSEGLGLAVDTYSKAVELRPDHPAGHRLKAYSLLRQGDLPGAFAALETALAGNYPGGRFLGVLDVLREDLGLLGAAWLRAAPGRRQEIESRLARQGARLARSSSTRFILTWETDANDVDFHITDGRGGHAYFSDPALRSGGRLYADVTTGYGPECFAIPGQAPAYPYRLEAHYYRRGPMGYGMGKLEIVEHDGRGGLKFAERPFVVMNDQAYVDLGALPRPLR